MKRVMKRLLTLMVLVVLLSGSCALFTPDASSLMGKVFTYYSNGGHDKAIYTFGATGKAGTFEIDTYTFSYSSPGDASTADVSTKTWRQTGGSKGSFTYDPVKFEYVQTVTQAYGPTAAAAVVTASPAVWDSYAWETQVIDYNKRNGSAYTAVDVALTRNLVFTMDNIESNAYAWVGGTIWANIVTKVETVETASSKTVTTTRTTDKLEISATAVKETITSVATPVVAGVNGTIATSVTTFDTKVNQWFAVGETAEVADWSQSWKDTKKVTLLCDMGTFSDVGYTGSTEPSAPVAADFHDGIADITPDTWVSYYSKTPPYYHVDKNSNPLSFTFEHHGTYILSKSDSAARSL